MEQVNVKEFQRRMSFWLKNLPVEVTSYGNVIAVVTAPGEEAAEYQETQTEKEQKIAALRKLIEPNVDTSTGEIVQPEAEQHTYTEYDGEKGEDVVITGTFEDFIRKCGSKQKATIAWRMGKPVKR